jgi:hypothetical protein
VAPSPAVQILELLLTQPPVGPAALQLLTRHWLDTAASAGRIVPPRLLPSLLELGTTGQADLRRAVAAVAGERGAWLAVRNPAWTWLAQPGDDPGEDVRDRIARTWETDTAQARAVAVDRLAADLGPGDEAFLEHCLDDRARAVRDAAARLLDRLPDSARAARMAERLRPLLKLHGTVRKELDVLLPDDPDPAAVRDGLVDPGPIGSRRARWRDQLVRGAPLGVWTEVVRGKPAKVLGMLRDHDGAIRQALTDAAAGRGDVEWARALLATTYSGRLVALLPEDERDAHLVARLSRQGLLKGYVDLVQAPRPWGPRLSRAVLTALGRQPDALQSVRSLAAALPLALHPEALPSAERLLQSAGHDRLLRTTMRDALQYQSLHRSISEAFR